MNCEYCCDIMLREKIDMNSEHKAMLMSGNVDMRYKTHHDIMYDETMEGL